MDLKSIVPLKRNPKIPDFRPGDTVRVMLRVVEGERERVQAFEGVVIRRRRGGINSNFTVRRVSHGIGVERTFPLYSPRLESVKVVRVGRVRRARLYYLRELVGRKARIRAGSRDRFEELTRELAGAEEQAPEEHGEEAAAGELEATDEAAVGGEVEEGAAEAKAEEAPEEEGAQPEESEGEPEGEEGAEAEEAAEEPSAEPPDDAPAEAEGDAEPEEEDKAAEE